MTFQLGFTDKRILEKRWGPTQYKIEKNNINIQEWSAKKENEARMHSACSNVFDTDFLCIKVVFILMPNRNDIGTGTSQVYAIWHQKKNIYLNLLI